MAYNILIVDDSATTRAFVRRSIAMAGFAIDAIYEAADGQQALDVLGEHSVDLVVVDLHMPGMGGIELTRRIFANDRLRDIPVVVASADPNTEELEDLRAAGVKSYVRKPFTPEAFRNALARFLEVAAMAEAQHNSETNQTADLTESLAQCLESMAFISVLPAQPPFEPPADLLQMELAFSGRAKGIMKLMASRAFGACFAANVLGVPVTDPAAATYATDALKELLNALTGSLLREWHGSGKFDLSLPTARSIEAPDWKAFVAAAGVSVLDAEGSLVAVRVVI